MFGHWNWSAAGEVLKALAPVATALAAWFGAYTAGRGCEGGVRKLSESGELKSLNGYSPISTACRTFFEPPGRLSFRWEMQPPEGKSDDSVKSSEYAPIRRLSSEREFLSEFRAYQYVCEDLFGREAAKPFGEVTTIHNEIFAAAEMLLDNRQQVSRHDPDFETYREFRQIAFRTQGENDAIEERMAASIRTIESTCRPAIEAREAI
jgi:hypothetical protein